MADGRRVARLYSRTGEDISGAFPDLIDALRFRRRDRRRAADPARRAACSRSTCCSSGSTARPSTPKLLAEFPAHLRAYDLLVEGGEDLRELPFAERRARLEALIARLDHPRIDISPLVPFATWDELTAARADPASAGAGADAEAVEGVMLKRRDAPYLPGRPKGLWWKWKRDPHVIDAVLMYAQRGHGKRSSFYSDYTFGVWTAGENGDELVPVGKAYFGFTDEELTEIDRYVRRNTVNRFGPVREVTHEPDQGLVLEVAFEGLQRSTRHKSGVAMRFPRISRLRWDKPPREADRLETLEKMLDASPRSAMIEFVIVCEHDARTPRGIRRCRTARQPLPRRTAARGALPARPAVRPGRRDPERARLRSRQHHRQHRADDPARSGTWASTRCAGCGAISCSAPSWWFRSG